MSLHNLEVIAAVLYLVLVAMYFGRAAFGRAFGQALCRIGLHDDGARSIARLGGYWLVCRRRCGHIESRVDRRRRA